MRIDANTPDEYFSRADERESDLRALDELIRQAAPGLKRTMVTSTSVNMVGYGMFTYRNKSGKEIQWPVLALANQKNHISLYISAVENGKYIAESNADKLGKVSVGKSCVRFKKFEDVDTSTLKNILQTLENRVAAGEVVYGF